MMETHLNTYDEEIHCPYCKAELDLTLHISVSPSVEASASNRKKSPQDVGEPVITPYEKRLPNIGELGEFFPAEYHGRPMLSNGFCVFTGLSGLELRMCEGMKKTVDMSILDKHFTDNLVGIVPKSVYYGFVYLCGDGVSRIVNRRYVDLVLTLYPDATLYVSPEKMCIMVKKGEEIQGFFMCMEKGESTYTPDCWENKG